MRDPSGLFVPGPEGALATGHGMPAVLEARGLGKRYGRRWALTDCTLAIPPGRVAGLVGPNGAGKTTLLNLAVGLLAPTSGTIEVLGSGPADGPGQLARVGFVAQDMPLYARLSVADHLRLGGWLNPGWDQGLAEDRIDRLGLDPRQRAGKLSSGQRAQLALTLAVAKRAELLVLDEPVAGLDPLARHEFLQSLTELAGGQRVSVVLSSHLIADLESVCDYLVVLVASRVEVAGPVAELLACHHRLTGPRQDLAGLPAGCEVIQENHTGSESTLVVRSHEPAPGAGRVAGRLSLQDLVLAYLSRAAHRAGTRPPVAGASR
jgi:ABC-2 type transport system ATP-binding protein